ncbi:MAG: hypothetical protein K0R66_1586 [Gammaproteobacteria bacterium]|jgi:hypothetical protein|nr:hypothetical protein [Gammaproteobacteria bacterium]
MYSLQRKGIFKAAADVPTVSIYGHPPHDLRHTPNSPRPFITVSDAVRMAQQGLGDTLISPTDLVSATRYAQALLAKRDLRIVHYQSSGVGRPEYSGMMHAAVENKSYYLCRPVNPEVANARLLCMLLGSEVVTKAMGVYEKSSKQPFSGGFLQVNADKIDPEQVRSLAERHPSLQRTMTSLRELEKAGEFYNIKLDVPLSFIYSLHAQSRIKTPRIEKDETGQFYLMVESNDKKGVIKWRCNLPKHSEHAVRPIEESPIYDVVPDWYTPLYHGSLEKQPEDKDFSNRMQFVSALRDFEAKLAPDAILESWREKLTRPPEWFIALQSSYPDANLKWELDQLFNVTEFKDGQYRDIIILGRTVNSRNIPVTSDYDLFAVIPNRKMSDDEIWELQKQASVLPERQIEILKRYDAVKVSLLNLGDVLLPGGSKLDPKKCFIDRERYFDKLSELGPLPSPGNNIAETDPRVRYKHNAITGYGTLAEGDLTAIFNKKAAEFHAHYEGMAQETAVRLSNRSSDSATSKHAVTSSKPSMASPKPRAYALSAHHGPETANPKPEPLPWSLKEASAGIFVCDIHGDFCALESEQDFIVFCQSIIAADDIYGTEHRIPLNAHWPKALVDRLVTAIGKDSVSVFNGADFKVHLDKSHAEARRKRISRIAHGEEVTPEKALELTGIKEEDSEEGTVATARTADLFAEIGLAETKGSATGSADVEPIRTGAISTLRESARSVAQAPALELAGHAVTLNQRRPLLGRLAPLHAAGTMRTSLTLLPGLRRDDSSARYQLSKL